MMSIFQNLLQYIVEPFTMNVIRLMGPFAVRKEMLACHFHFIRILFVCSGDMARCQEIWLVGSH